MFPSFFHPPPVETHPFFFSHRVKLAGAEEPQPGGASSGQHAALRSFTRRAHQLLAKQHQRACESRRAGAVRVEGKEPPKPWLGLGPMVSVKTIGIVMNFERD